VKYKQNKIELKFWIDESENIFLTQNPLLIKFIDKLK